MQVTVWLKEHASNGMANESNQPPPPPHTHTHTHTHTHIWLEMTASVVWGSEFWLQIQRSRVRFPAILDFLRSSGSGTGSTQPRESS
jgi:hypothetical protein